MRLIELIKLHEGLRLKPYRCTAGKLSIGIGRNLDDVGISEREAHYLFRNDLLKVQDEAMGYEWFFGLDPVRRAVVIDMLFNLGKTKFDKFVNTQKAIAAHDFKKAAEGMSKSLWYKQVKSRGVRLVKMMETGEWPEEILGE